MSAYRVKDGDTVEVLLKVTAPIRIFGVDTPEKLDKRQNAAAVLCEAETERWLAGAGAVRVRIYRLGLYRRFDGDLVNQDGESLSAWLVSRGLAVPTDGNKRHEWTDEELRNIEMQRVE